jgi:hypothetical protein
MDAALAQRLGELGWIEGRTIAIEYRWAEGRPERYAEIAAEFVRLKVDVIVTTVPAVPAAKQATSFLMGAAPLIASIWFAGVSAKASSLLTGLWSVLLLLGLIALGWFGGRPLLRLAESSFWSLNALAVQPGYVLTREVIQHWWIGARTGILSDIF